jgi:hypothetical protein
MEQSPSWEAVTQLVEKFPELCSPKVHYSVHKSPSLVLILSQMHPVQTSLPYFPKIHSNIILPSSPKSFECYCFQRTCPIETPNIPCYKFHVQFPLSTSFQRIRPIPRPRATYRNQLGFYGEQFLAPLPRASWRTTSCRLSVTGYVIYSQLTIHLHLVPRSRMRGAIPPLPHYTFMVWCLFKQRIHLNSVVLPSISGGRLLRPQPKDAPCRDDRDPHKKCVQYR